MKINASFTVNKIMKSFDRYDLLLQSDCYLKSKTFHYVFKDIVNGEIPNLTIKFYKDHCLLNGSFLYAVEKDHRYDYAGYKNEHVYVDRLIMVITEYFKSFKKQWVRHGELVSPRMGLHKVIR